MFAANRLTSLFQVSSSIVWMAPSSKTFKTAVTDAALGGAFTFYDGAVEAAYFETVTAAPSTIVVSAQPVTKDFLQAWKNKNGTEQQNMTLVRRGTSLGSVDLAAATELGIKVVNTPGVNSPHVAKFTVETLFKLNDGEKVDAKNNKTVVFGAGSVGGFVINQLNGIGVKPVVVNRSDIAAKGITAEQATQATAEEALVDATHVAVCCATSGEPVITEALIEKLINGNPETKTRPIRICSVARPEAFSLDAILKLPEESTELRFDYGATVLAPMQEKIKATGGRDKNVSWSSLAMASEACKEDLDGAVLEKLEAGKQ